ncbi:MAG TPA: lipoyl(octanoyl) transferase LipB [Flavobacteriales bacterium]|nr:lipoyl(octanoyl) transferase LipB [Flavobacteriales bacterium]
MQKVHFQELGLIDYKECWDYQEKLFSETVKLKISNRKSGAAEQVDTQNYLLFCEHPHVYTMGKTGSLDNLLLNEGEFAERGLDYYKINRGGDVTYHGPGQIVGYPILDLDNFFTDIGKYLRLIEETIIQTLAHYGLNGGRITGATGVWLDADKPSARKICAIGVRTSRWVTMHGFAFNVNTELDYFKNIIPCGIDDKPVTSMSKELRKKVNIREVKELLKENFSELFDVHLISSISSELAQS